MANSLNSNDDMNVYLSFTIAEPLRRQSQQSHVRELLQKKFGRNEIEQVIDVKDGSNEAIFRIATPALHTPDMLKSFFESLQFVMKATPEFSPHFTQPVKEEAR